MKIANLRKEVAQRKDPEVERDLYNPILQVALLYNRYRYSSLMTYFNILYYRTLLKGVGVDLQRS